MFRETTRGHEGTPGIVPPGHEGTPGSIPLRLRSGVLEALLAQLDAGVLVLDADGRVIYANEAARRLRDDGDLLADRHGGPVSWASDLATARALLTGEAVRGEEVEYFGAAGRRRWVRLDATPVRDHEGAVTAVVGTLADVTPAKHDAAWAPVIESLARL